MRRIAALLLGAFMVLMALPARAGDVSERLLMSSAWCTFKYNKISGYSNTTRYTFNSNGTYSMGGRGEGYSSGSGGSMASQRNSRAAGRWRVVNGELYIGEGANNPQPVRTVVKRNNNGYPIIVADGTEFSSCK